MYATREALDRSTVRLALPVSEGTKCYPLTVYNPSAPQILGVTGGGSLVAYQASTGRVQWRGSSPRKADCTLALDPSTDLAAVGAGADIDLLNPANGSLVGRLDPALLHPAAGLAGPLATPNGLLTFSANGSELLALTGSNQLEIWNMATRSGLAVEVPASVNTATFTPDGTRVVLGTVSGTLLIIDTATGATVQTVTVGGPTDQIVAVASPTGHTLAVADSPVTGAPTTVGLWSTTSWSPQSNLASFGPIAVADLAFASDGEQLAVGLADGAGNVWSLSTHHELAQFLGQTSQVRSVSFSQDAKTVLVSTLDGSARAYRATGPGLASLQMSTSLNADSLQWSGHAVTSIFASGTSTCVPECRLESWSWPGRVLTGQHVLSTNPAALIAASGPRALVATPDPGGSTWTIRVWDSSPFRLVRSFTQIPIGPQTVTTNAFVKLSDDGRYMEVALADAGTKGAHLRTYDVSSGKVVATRWFPTPTGDACGIDDSTGTPRGSIFVMADYCGHAWVVRTNSRVPILTTSTGGRESGMAISPSGNQLAITSWDGIATVIDTRTGHRLFQLVGNPEGMTNVAYSPDGRYIVTTSANGDVQTWSTADGRLLRTQEDTYDPSYVAFTPAGQVFTLDVDNTLRLWDPCSSCQDPAALLASARKAIVSPLTTAEQQQSGAG